MKFTNFLKYLPKIELNELPGIEAQFKLAPKIREKKSEVTIRKSQPKKAGVLVLFYPDHKNNVQFLLTKRATYKGKHSAQISFPGGKIEENDNSIYKTALREAHEEIGLNPKEVKIIRKVSNCYIPPSNFLVSPVLAYANVKPEFVINYEVEALISVALEDLLDNKNQTTTKMTTSYMENMDVPCYFFGETLVWGATAMVLSEIKELLTQSFLK